MTYKQTCTAFSGLVSPYITILKTEENLFGLKRCKLKVN